MSFLPMASMGLVPGRFLSGGGGWCAAADRVLEDRYDERPCPSRCPDRRGTAFPRPRAGGRSRGRREPLSAFVVVRDRLLGRARGARAGRERIRRARPAVARI